MLRDYGISLTMMAGYDTHFAIYDAHLRYLAQARLDDELNIKTSCKHIKASTLEFKQTIYKGESSLLCEATLQVVCLNGKLKPQRLPAEHFQGLFSI